MKLIVLLALTVTLISVVIVHYEVNEPPHRWKICDVNGCNEASWINQHYRNDCIDYTIDDGTRFTLCGSYELRQLY